jgi:MFS transporter, ACS family, D-galactonate transporter
MIAPKIAHQKLGPMAPVLGLLALFLLINYIDRGNLSIAAPLLKDELQLSPARLGILLSAFFYTYTACVFFVGWLVDRFDVNMVLAAGFLVWSLATALTGLAHGFALLFAFRLLLGIGESVAFPATSKILARHVSETHRGFANGLLTAGMKVGPAVGSLGGGLLMARYGWRAVFLGVGLGSLLWLPLWWKWRPKGTAESRAIPSSTSIGFIEIMFRRSFWGASAGHFCGNYVLYFLVTWLPSYLVEARGLSMQQMSKTAAAYYATEALFALAAGWATDAFVRRGSSPTIVRKASMGIGHVVAALGLIGCAFAGPDTYLLALFFIALGSGMLGSGIFACAQILAGPRTAGRWVGLQNGFANFAGVIGPALTGFVVGWTGSFTVALGIAALVSLAGALAWTLVVGPLEETCWDQPASPLAV